MKKLSIIIISYNSEKYIGTCLESLKNCGVVNYEIIVVDNNSEDKTAQIVQNYKMTIDHIIFVQNKNNFGFAKACNQGVKMAKGKYILFLNPDTIVQPGALKILVNNIEKNPDIGVIGPMLLNPDRSLQYSIGKYPTIVNIIADRIPIINKIFYTEQIRHKAFYSYTREPDWICGAALMVRKSIFSAIGGFSQKYFMYGEDIDLCFNVKRSGYQIMYIPNAQIVHFNDGRNQEKQLNKFINIRKGFLIFFRIHYSIQSYIVLKWLFIIEAFIKRKPFVES